LQFSANSSFELSHFVSYGEQKIILTVNQFIYFQS